MPLPIPPPTRNRILALSVLAACAVCVAFPRAWRSALRGQAHRLALGPQCALAAAHGALQRAIDRARALWATGEEVRRLRQENQALREALARQIDQGHRLRLRLEGLAKFDQFRRSVLRRPVRIVPATVVAVDASPWRHSVVIDRGSASGLRPGTPAVWGNSIVGTVVAVRRSVATVRLITDSRAGLTVRVARTGDVGVLRGTGEPGARLALKWIHLHPIRKDDLVVTSEHDPLVPAGLVAGRVARASRTPSPLFYDVEVRPLVDLGRLGELLALIYRASEVDELLEEDAAEGN